MDPSSPTEAPPPAYDAVQIEFDRKISDAVERSLQISEPPPPKVGEDGYEVWDDNTFEANERARQSANKVQSGSRPSDYHREKARLPEMDTAGATSSVENRSSGSKPHPPSSPPSKERPRWLADAQISGAPATPSGQGPGVSDLNLPSEDDYPDEELPPFTAVAPSLEGPPFEEVVRQPARYPASQTDSPPESPLDGVGGYESPPRFQNPPPRRHYDIRPQNVPVRPVTSRPPAPMRHPLPTSSRPPTMLFDPKIAYSRNHQFLATESELEGPVDAAALYKYVYPLTPCCSYFYVCRSAVSSLMKTQDSTTRRLPPIPQATEPYDYSLFWWVGLPDVCSLVQGLPEIFMDHQLTAMRNLTLQHCTTWLLQTKTRIFHP